MINKHAFLLILFSFAFYVQQYAQTVTLSGWVKNLHNNSPLPNATIVVVDTQEGIITNEQGYFSLELPKKSIDLECSYVGFQPIRRSLSLVKDTTITFYLSPNSELQTVEIIASESTKLEEKTATSTIQLSAAQINQVPTFLGEQDVLKVLQLLPSVQAGAEGQSSMQVRGGSPDQNLILLDGIPIYNPSHLFGFFSVFNGDIIDKVSFSSGGFPAQYAGRLSSIVDIETLDGDFTEWNADLSLGSVSGKLLIHGPIIKNKTSVLMAARRSLLDVWGERWLNRIYQDDSIDGSSNYHFTDYNVKVVHQLNEKNQITIGAFQGTDDYQQQQERVAEDGSSAQSDLATNWKNVNAFIGWNHIWADSWNSQLLLYLNQYNYGQERFNAQENREFTTENFFSYKAGIEDIGLKWQFQQSLLEDHQLTYGVQLTHHRFFTGDYIVKQSDSRATQFNIDSTFTSTPVKAFEGGLYLEDKWTIHRELSIRGGAHLGYYQVAQKAYFSFQPRVTLRAIGPGDIAYKFSFSSMQQNLHLLATDNGGFPSDLWLPATDQVRPQRGWIVAAQIAKTFGDMELSVEPYYRILKDPIAFREGKSILNPEDWQQKVTQGQGTMYGIEFLLRKKTGRLNGWLAYTLSSSKRQFEELNNGNWYPYTLSLIHI